MEISSFKSRFITAIISISVIATIFVLTYKYYYKHEDVEFNGIIGEKEKYLNYNNYPNTPYSGVNNESIEFKLAAIDNNSKINVSSYQTSRFEYLLNNIHSKTRETKIRIADMTVTAQNKLKENGIKESLLNIMEGMNEVLYSNVEGQSYSEYVSAYIVFRTQGQSHRDAILDLIAMMKAFSIK